VYYARCREQRDHRAWTPGIRRTGVLLSIMREMLTKLSVDVSNGTGVRVQRLLSHQHQPPNSTLARFKQISGYRGTPTRATRRGRISGGGSTRRFSAAPRGDPCLCTPTRQMRQSTSLIAYGDIEANFVDSETYKEFNDWELWTRLGYLDTAIPMNYDRSTTLPRSSISATRFRRR